MSPSHGRSKSIFSTKSQESNDSAGNPRPKINSKDLKNAPKDHREHAVKYGQTTKNPNFSMTEPTPGERAQQEGNTLSPLRAIQHKDYFGNVIVDADASNPTRPRLERPLDTIRSFEAAIDEGHKRRSHVTRTESADAINHSSRRSSFVEGHNDSRGYERGYDRGYDRGYGGSRLSSGRQGGSYPMRPSPYRGSTAPMSSQPVYEYDGYPSHGYHESYDTVYTGESSGSQSTEPWTNSTDPSSENSSMDRVQPYATNKMEHDAYGQNGRMYGYPQNGHGGYQQNGQNGYQQNGQNGYQQNHLQQAYPQQYPAARPSQMSNGAGSMAPPAPSHVSQPRQPIRLNANGMDAGPKPAAPPSNGPKLQKKPSDSGKHKSWLKRRFSKG